MCLTAKDMLADIRTRADAVRTIGWLIGDVSAGIVKEHSKQVGERMMKKQSRPTTTALWKAALLGLQIVWVPIMAFLFTEPIFHAATEPKDPYTYVSWATNVGPVFVVALSLYLLRNFRGPTLWSWIVRAFVLSTVGLIGLSLFGTEVDNIWISYGFYHRISLNPSLYDGFILLVYLAVFYVVGQWLVRSIAAGRTKPALVTRSTKR